MAEWLTVNKATGFVVAWQRGGSGVPADTETTAYVVTDDAGIEQFEQLKRQAARDVREPDITLVSGVPTLAPDTRLIFEIVSDKTDVLLGDTVTLTCTAYQLNGTSVRTALNSTIIRDWGDKRLRFDFVSGVATRSLAITEPKRLSFYSGRSYRLRASLSIDVYE
jgi:hypothetical protein